MNPAFFPRILLLLTLALLSACATVVDNATSQLTDQLGTAILNQNDPETVRDGAPAFLLVLDSLAAGDSKNPELLATTAELYAAYGTLFVTEPERSARLTERAFDYGQQALCASNGATCGAQDLRYQEFLDTLDQLTKADAPALYSYSLAWLAQIQSNAGDMSALSKLPRAKAALERVATLDPDFRSADVARYLGVVATIRPPALGGDFPAGKAYFERALELSGGKDLSVPVDYARYYARTLYDRELHDQLLKAALAADPVAPGLTLMNTLAQRNARELLDGADDHF